MSGRCSLLLAAGLVAAMAWRAGAQPSPTAPPTWCVGDCNGDGAVAVNELVMGVGIELGSTSADACVAYARACGPVDDPILLPGRAAPRSRRPRPRGEQRHGRMPRPRRSGRPSVGHRVWPARIVQVDGKPCPDSVKRCASEQLGEPCSERWATCCEADSDCTGDICNAGLLCNTEPPLDVPDLAPALQAGHRVPGTDRPSRNCTMRCSPSSWPPSATSARRPAAAPHLGFIIEDVEPSPSVDSAHDMVDLYGYLSMAVGAIQVQAKQIEALQQEVRGLRQELQRADTEGPPLNPRREHRAGRCPH